MSERGTEKATPQRKKKAREKGDGVRSRDLLSAAAMMGGALILRSAAPKFVEEWNDVYLESVRFAMLKDVKVESDWIFFVHGVLVHAWTSAGMILVACRREFVTTDAARRV